MVGTESTSLIVSLIDRISGPARQASTALRGIGGAARSVNGTLAGRLSAALDDNTRRLDAMRGRMIDAAAAGYGLYRALKAPVEAFTEFESKLEDIRQKINLPHEELPKLGAEIRKVARDTANLSQNIAQGFDILAGMGASASDALGMLPAIGKAAVAYRAQITDLSNAGYAALDNLKVPADQFARALDAMAQAGKAGAFELKDMATYFPQLGAAYQGLKQQGVPAVADLAAALQIVRKGTGDASSAATNLGNILQKIYAPATTKAFGKLGVNLRKEMDKAAKAGMTPIEAIAEITNRVLKGDLSKLGDLFQDAQVQQGLRPLIQNIEEYRKIRAEALKAQGVVEADYQERLKTGAMAGQRFAVAMESINIAVGSALMPALADLATALVPIMNSFARFAENNPGLTRALVGTAAAAIGLNVALTAASFGGLFLFGGLLKVAKGGFLAGKGIAKVGGLIGSLLGMGKTAQKILPASLEGFGRVSQAVTWNSRAATDASRRMVQGMGAARQASDRMISGMSGAAANSSTAGFTTFGQRAGSALSSGFSKMLAIGGLVSVAMMVIDDLNKTADERLEQIRKNGEAWRGMSKDLDESGPGQAWQSVVAKGQELKASIAAMSADFYSAGSAMIGSLWDGAVAKFDELLAWAGGIAAKIKTAIGSVDLSSMFSGSPSAGPSAPGSLGTPTSGYKPDAGYKPPPGISGARADGGPVIGGKSYLVGEQGPELFRPRQSGHVIPNHELSANSQVDYAGTAIGSHGGNVTVHAPISVSIKINGSSAADLKRMARQAAEEVVTELTSTLDRQLSRSSQIGFTNLRFGGI